MPVPYQRVCLCSFVIQLLLVGNLNSGDRTNYELSSSWEVKDWIETFSRGRGPNSPALYEILCSIAHCASTPTGFLSNG